MTHTPRQIAMCEEYQAWLTEHGYPSMCAMELQFETDGNDNWLVPPHTEEAAWLKRFIAEWDHEDEIFYGTLPADTPFIWEGTET